MLMENFGLLVKAMVRTLVLGMWIINNFDGDDTAGNCRAGGVETAVVFAALHTLSGGKGRCPPTRPVPCPPPEVRPRYYIMWCAHPCFVRFVGMLT